LAYKHDWRQFQPLKATKGAVHESENMKPKNFTKEEAFDWMSLQIESFQQRNNKSLQTQQQHPMKINNSAILDASLENGQSY